MKRMSMHIAWQRMAKYRDLAGPLEWYVFVQTSDPGTLRLRDAAMCTMNRSYPAAMRRHGTAKAITVRLAEMPGFKRRHYYSFDLPTNPAQVHSHHSDSRAASYTRSMHAIPNANLGNPSGKNRREGWRQQVYVYTPSYTRYSCGWLRHVRQYSNRDPIVVCATVKGLSPFRHLSRYETVRKLATCSTSKRGIVMNARSLGHEISSRLQNVTLAPNPNTNILHVYWRENPPGSILADP
ncbi:hypothetical protein EV127DRAFT_467308 [Xylaria flabelliformis]|nr:hypothetical protein EV127DRAFT_467308 [Xylaria flabelliformis]